MRSDSDFKFFFAIFASFAQNNEFNRNIAVSYGDHSITYQELNQKSNLLARLLLHKYGLSRDDIVVIALPPSIEAVVSMLAIMKAGAAFSFLSLPEQQGGDYIGLDQFKYTINFLRPKALITNGLTIEQGLIPSESPTLNITSPEVFSESNGFTSDNLNESEVSHHPSQLAYVTFTSGTSGNPKGVLIEHLGLYSRLVAHQELIHLKPGDKVAQFCPLAVDASIMEIMLALGTGAELVIIPPIKSTIELDRYYRASKINVAIFTPASLVQLISLADSPDLRCILTTGEKVSAELLNIWSNPSRIVINGYGPCEVTIGVSLSVYDPSTGEISVGRPMKGVEFAILNPETLAPVAPTEEGELYLGGLGVGRGYIIPLHEGVSVEDRGKLELLNSERFLKPTEKLSLAFTDKPMKWYRTGDKVKLNSKNEIIILDRYDNQFKIRGVFVSPDHIAEFISAHPLVSSSQKPAVYAYLRKVDKKDHIVVGIHYDADISEENLLSLAKHALGLNKTLIPHRWYISNHPIFELTTAWKSTFGKSVRDKKPSELMIARQKFTSISAPLSPLHFELLHMWREILLTEEEKGLSQYEFGIDDNFRYIGGDSLAEKELINEFVKNYPDVPFPYDGFSQSPTIRYLASYIYHCRMPLNLNDLNSSILPGGNKPALYFIHPVTGEVMANYMSLATDFTDRKAFGVAARDYADENWIMNSIYDVAADYKAAIFKQHSAMGKRPNDVFVIIGHSAGGVIAYELAIQLEKNGYNAIAILLDTLSPRFIRKLKPEQSQALVRGLVQALVEVYSKDLAGEVLTDADYRVIPYTSHDKYLQAVFEELIKKVSVPAIKLKLLRALKLALAIWHYRPISKPKSAYLWVANRNGWYHSDPHLGWEVRPGREAKATALDQLYEIQEAYEQSCDHNGITMALEAKAHIKSQIECLAREPAMVPVYAADLKRLETTMARMQSGSVSMMGGSAALFSVKSAAAVAHDVPVDVIKNAIQYIEFSEGPAFDERVKRLISEPNLPKAYHRGRKALETLKDLMGAGDALSSLNLAWVAVTGVAGSGKTELVKDYGHYYHAVSGKLVLYFNGEDDIVHQFRLMAVEKLGFKYDISADTTKLVLEEILEKNPGFLLIFENVQRLNQLQEHLRFKKAVNGRILITSRKQSILPSAIGVSFDLSKGLQRDEAKAILLGVREGENEAMAELLAARVGFLPLAIDQAARYIKRKNKQSGSYSIRKYYDELDRDPLGLWSVESRPEGYHDTYERVIAKTFEDLIELDQHEVLKVLAVLSHNRIPVDLIKQWVLVKGLRDAKDRADEFVDLAIVQLEDLGLIAVDDGYINIHLVVQDVVKVRSIRDILLEQVLPVSEVLIANLDKIFRYQAGSITAGRSVVGHVEVVLGHLSGAIPKIVANAHMRFLIERMVCLLHRLGTHYERNNLFLQAYSKYHMALELSVEYKDLVDAKQLAHIYHSLGSIAFRTLEDLEQAEYFLNTSLTIRQKLFGFNTYESNGYNPTLHALHNLGYLLIHYSYINSYRKDKRKLEEKLKQARAIYDLLLIDSENPEGHPGKSKIKQSFYLAAAYINSGNVARLLGDYSRAERDFGFAKMMLAKMPDKSHFEMAEAYNNFGFYYLEPACLDLAQAEANFEYSRLVCKKFMVPNEELSVSLHLSTAYEGLAKVSMMREDFVNAVKYAHSSLACRVMIYTSDHIRVQDARELVNQVQALQAAAESRMGHDSVSAIGM